MVKSSPVEAQTAADKFSEGENLDSVGTGRYDPINGFFFRKILSTKVTTIPYHQPRTRLLTNFPNCNKERVSETFEKFQTCIFGFQFLTMGQASEAAFERN